MKVMFDIDPRSLKRLESLAAIKQLSIGELAGELVMRILNREPGHGPASASSSSGLHPAQGSASSSGRQPVQGAANAAQAIPGIDEHTLVMLLEPLLARFRLVDADGSQRRAVVAELSMMLPDTTAAKLIGLIRRSLDG